MCSWWQHSLNHVHIYLLYLQGEDLGRGINFKKWHRSLFMLYISPFLKFNSKCHVGIRFDLKRYYFQEDTQVFCDWLEEVKSPWKSVTICGIHDRVEDDNKIDRVHHSAVLLLLTWSQAEGKWFVQVRSNSYNWVVGKTQKTSSFTKRNWLDDEYSVRLMKWNKWHFFLLLAVMSSVLFYSI